MSETTIALPQKFAFLEPFAAQWGALETQRERYLLRQTSKMEDLKRFHAAAANRLNEIFDYLDGFPAGALPAPEARLYRTVLGLAEVMQAVEVFGEARVKNAPYPHDIDVTWNDVSKTAAGASTRHPEAGKAND